MFAKKGKLKLHKVLSQPHKTGTLVEKKKIIFCQYKLFRFSVHYYIRPSRAEKTLSRAAAQHVCFGSFTPNALPDSTPKEICTFSWN